MDSENYHINLENHPTKDISDSHVNGSLTVIWRDYDNIINSDYECSDNSDNYSDENNEIDYNYIFDDNIFDIYYEIKEIIDDIGCFFYIK